MRRSARRSFSESVCIAEQWRAPDCQGVLQGVPGSLGARSILQEQVIGCTCADRSHARQTRALRISACRAGGSRSRTAAKPGAGSDPVENRPSFPAQFLAATLGIVDSGSNQIFKHLAVIGTGSIDADGRHGNRSSPPADHPCPDCPSTSVSAGCSSTAFFMFSLHLPGPASSGLPTFHHVS